MKKILKETMVSIIVPCYNYAQYLGEALDSVIAQTHPNWECIIINDESTDNTEEVAQKYCKQDKRFNYLSKKNGGPSAARNLGIKNSKGKYILPLDPDDRITGIFLESAIQQMENDENIKIVASPAQLFGDVNQVIQIPDYDLKQLLIVNYLFNTSMYRREDFEKTPGYDEDIFGLEDWDLWISILKSGGIVAALPFAGYFYRQKNDCVFRDLIRDKKRMFRHLLQLYNNHADIYEEYFDSPIVLIQENEKMKRVIEAYQQTKTYKLGLSINKIKKTFKPGR